MLFLIPGFQYTYGASSDSNLNKLVEEQVNTKFLDGERPLRYYSNILIRLQGNPTREDSLIFEGLVDTLNVLIDKWDVYLIPKGTSNLDVEINEHWRKEEENKIIEQGDNPWQIVKKTIVINYVSEMDFKDRKKIIYYYLLRSLVDYKTEKGKTIPISGSVFTETKPENITFHPVDFAIIKELYSSKYEDKPIKRGTIRMEPGTIQSVVGGILINIISLMLSFSFLILMSLFGKFKDHNYSFFPFLKQGLLVVAAGSIYLTIRTIMFFIHLEGNENIFFHLFVIIFTLFLFGFVVISLIFLVERAIFAHWKKFYMDIIIPFLSIVFFSSIFILLALFLIPLSRPYLSIYSSTLSGAVFFFLLMGFGRSVYIFTRKKSEILIRKKDLELAQMSELQKQAELQSLRAKINPHFLYNALNSIASLATTDAGKTEQMALALSDFFKYAINREQKQLNTLSEELNATRTYLEIEKVRFGDRLTYEIECPSELLEIQIPQLLIQPLVENAIKHGLSQITGNGVIKVTIRKVENFIKIRIYDNGPAFPDGPLTGFGIRNTQERITLLYGQKASVNWVNGGEKYIELNLPSMPEVVKKINFSINYGNLI